MCDDELAMRACAPVAAGTPPLSGHDLEHLLGHAEGWEVEVCHRPGLTPLPRRLLFKGQPVVGD